LGGGGWSVVVLEKKRKKKKVGSSFSFERGRREGVFLGCVWWFVSTAGQSCGDPIDVPSRIDLLQLFEFIVSMSQSDR
jgi:hypothetical protein